MLPATVSLVSDESRERTVRTSDSGETTMWLAIAAPIILIVALAALFAVWMWTGPVIALIVFAGLCGVGASAAAALQRRSRGL